ncbi:hypothetical protein EV196_108245 [Mariniflexile fucanivorans]|uniref:Uncharacterized protein n=1 Tax=Mariniflexile fucanivorans TaxID=264023 RepID=A0A4R1RDU4_9FLAO|nr:hypothetical protein [Mariniflexile fucanivorans]TCL64045.1 hypothetical protein EV196_108245 [Mariniflexile fucanivorans]
MPLKEELKKQIDEAIASENTSDSNRKLLVEIKEDLNNAKNEKQYFSFAIKVIELIGALAKVFVAGSG